MISPDEITIIIQGSVIENETKRVIDSIKKYLPAAQIILSTWENSDTNNLNATKIIKNHDPGSFFCDTDNNIQTNINRQLISTKNALPYVKTLYAMKLRSDLYFTSNKFLKYFDIYRKYDTHYKFFKGRLMVNSLTSKLYSDVGDNLPTPFHISDWFYFGYTEDVKKFFNAIPIIDDEKAFSHYKLKYLQKNPCPHLLFKYAPEQYFSYMYFKSKFSNIHFDDWSDFNDENIECSQKFIANNFIILDTVQHGIYSNKHINLIKNNNGRKFKFKGYITHYKFLKLYKKYCDKKFIMPIQYWFDWGNR